MKNDGLMIFDLDGTLFETETVSIPAVRSAFAEHGLTPPSRQEVTDLFGHPERDFYGWLGEKVPAELVSRVADAVGRCELELVSRAGRLYPGVRESLEALEGSVGQMAICSNGPEPYVRTVVEAHGLSDFFDEVRWRRAEDTSKSEMIRDILGRLISRPGAVVGDRRDDVLAAHENGLRAIAASYGYGRQGELDGADCAIDDLAELPGIVSKLLFGEEGPEHR